MEKAFRKTGIDIVGDVPWGTHFCQFYETREDLVEILASYFKAGLENNEFCMWITSEPLKVEEAKAALKKVVKNLDHFIKKGQIEILDYSEWYTKSGKFDASKVLQGWVEKENQALKRGYDGLRLSGNTFWLEKREWRNFTDYEDEVNKVIGKYRMIALCAYSLSKCGASEVMDVVSNHQFALIRREGEWVIIESSERKSAEEEIKSLAKFPSENPFPVLRLDKDGVVLYANEASYGLLQDWGSVVNSYAPIFWRDLVGEALSSQSRRTIDIKFGEQTYSFDVVPILDAGYVNLYGIDITERKRAEEVLHYQATLLANTHDAIIASDEHYRLTAWNAAAESLFGWKAEEVLGRFGLDVTQTEFPVVDKDEMLRTIAETGHWRGEVTQARKDGTRIPVEVASIVLHDESGRITGYVSVNRDITERKRAEEKIKDLAKFPAENPAPILRLNQDGIVLYANEASQVLLRNWGCTVGVCAPKFWRDLSTEVLTSQSRRMIDIQLGEQTYSFDLVPILDAGYVNLYGIDITERKRAEEAVRKSEGKYRSLTENINLGIYRNTVGPEGKFIEANPAIIGMFGYKSKEEFLAINVSDLYQNAEDRIKFNDKMLKNGFVRGEELWLKKKDGSLFVGSKSAVAVKDEQGHVKYYDGIIEDITERKRAEEALKKSIELLNDTGEMARVGGWELNLSTNEVSWTDEVGRIHGVGPGYNLKLEEALDFYAPESRLAVEAVVKKAAETGEPYDLESLFIPRGSKEKIWVRSLGRAIYSGGKIVKLTGTFQNIDKYKRAEETRTRLLADLEAKNRELEAFVYTVSHDLKTPLVSLGGFSSILQKEYESQLGEEGKRYLERIHDNVSYMDALIASLLELSRIGQVVGPIEEIDVAALLREMRNMLAVRLKEAGAEFVVQEPLPTVRADRARIRQVFVNLIDNAVKFRSAERALRIEVGCRQESGFYRFHVADNGLGIAPQYHEQIFAPFRKLHPEIEGVGIGLALVKKIVEHHGGRVWVESPSASPSAGHERAGVTFYFTLPIGVRD